MRASALWCHRGHHDGPGCDWGALAQLQWGGDQRRKRQRRASAESRDRRARTITLGSSSATSLTAAQSLTLSRGLNSAGRVTFWDDFFRSGGATIPIHWSKDVLNSATGDYGDRLEGRYTLAMTAADEAQAVQIVGPKINLDNGPILKCGFFSVDSTKFISVERFAIGLVDTHTNSEDSLDATTVNAWFRVEGSSHRAALGGG